MTMHKAIYPSLEAYYAADERRLRSEECDYGVHWRLKGWEYRWRVSYVRQSSRCCRSDSLGCLPRNSP